MAKAKLSKQMEQEPLFSRHLVLVLAMLVALLLSELFVFIFVGKDKDFLALILTSFGAWIGAGAAYFFGRENLKTATDSMLKVRGISPQEKLEQTTLSELKPRPIDGKYKEDASVFEVKRWLDEDPDRYFVVLIDNDGAAEKVLHEEGLMRYLLSRTMEEHLGIKDDDLKKVTLKDVFKYIEDTANVMKKDNKINTANAFLGLANCAVILKESDSAKTARDNMERQHLLVTIVVDGKGKPVGYITSTDIEKVMFSD